MFNTSLQWCKIVHICELYAVKHVRTKDYLTCMCVQMLRISRYLLVHCAKGAEFASFAVHFWSSLD